MYWIQRFFRHLLFVMGADVVKNPEKYGHYARRTKDAVKRTAVKTTAQIKCSAANAKESVRKFTERTTVASITSGLKKTLAFLGIAAVFALFLAAILPIFFILFIVICITMLWAKYHANKKIQKLREMV